MASEVVRYVNTASSGGDGTTNATSGGTAAYASLSACESAERANLVTGDQWLHIKCTGSSADTTAVHFSSANWTTDSTRYIKITVNAGEEHGGIWPTSTYRLSSDDYHGTLRFTGVDATVDGLPVENTYNSTDGNRHGVYIESGSVKVLNCIIRKTNGVGSSNFNGIQGNNGVTAVTAVNNIVYDFRGGINAVGDSGGTFIFYNNTIANAVHGIYVTRYSSGGTWYIKNNIIDNSSTADYSEEGSAGTVTTVTNYTSDGTSPDGASYQTKTFTFVSASDFHLAAGDSSGAKTGGTDLSGDGQYSFSTDIDGDTRSSWSAGADEYTAASTTLFRRGIGVGLGNGILS